MVKLDLLPLLKSRRSRSKCAKFALSSKLTISGELLVRFGPNKKQLKAYSVHRLFVFVTRSFSAFVTSQITICKFCFGKKNISREPLVRFGSNKNQRKAYSVHRLFVIVSVSVGTLVTSQMTKYCVTPLIKRNMQSGFNCRMMKLTIAPIPL